MSINAGHQVVNVVFDSTKTSYEKMLDIFWETHDPTTLNRQGNDVGSQYRTLRSTSLLRVSLQISSKDMRKS